ncbi:BTAD domain-containing putative transcriptional regulator [Nonomuraea sp. NPDC049695]|uniref:BTAD domain-containing putative transcriptional regulator n=1 Tax=Nonomuraea sp. NPDC049695 TaxID=3154734 RepID=UPI00344AA913
MRVHRRRAGLTQQQLSRRAGVSVRAVRDIEQGRVRHPRSESARRLAAAVGLAGGEAATAAARAEGTPAAPSMDGGSGADGRLSVGVLGPLTVHHGSRTVTGPLMQRSLLGLLALQPGQPVGFDEIIDTLWGEDPPPTCRNLVRSYVARLRALLRPARAGSASAQVLVSAGRSGGYVFTVGDGELDLLRFDALTAQAHKVRDTDPRAALELLTQALGCWRGAALADLPRVRQHPAATAVTQRRVAAALEFADLALRLGAHRQAAERLRALVAVEPLHEGLHARLMLALAGSGEQAAALELFTRFRDLLVRELGVEPGAELRDAQARVLQGDLAPIRPPDRTTASGTTAASTATASTAAAGTAAASVNGQWRPAQLPADVLGFTGRAELLERLDALLEAGEGDDAGTTLVLTAIAGAAGVGKTALATHWAHRVAVLFPDGQLYINLQGYAQHPPLSSLQALGGLLRAFGVAPEQIPTETEQAAALYRSLLADKRVLVVLDNTRDAEQVRPLLPGSPGCVVVITSRDRLTGLVATHGAHCVTLDLFSPEEAVALLVRLLGAERVAAEPAAAHELARLCGFLPLALRIAAANLTSRPEKSIAAYLAELRAGDRLGGLAVAGDPQAAVRIAFDHSYDRLPPESRRLFRLLGLVPGPQVSVPGAAALAGVAVEVAGRLLDELADAHLVEPRGHGRYGLHDLLGLYARRRAQQHDGQAHCEAALERLLDWYLHSIDAAAELLYPEEVRLPPLPSAAGTSSPTAFIDHSQAAAWLEVELANLVAATQYAADHGPHPAAWRLADALRGYFWQRRPMVEWLLVAQAGLDAATVAGDVRAQALSHLSLGQANRAASRSQPARRHIATALTLARQAGWTDGQAAALFCQANVAMMAGDLHQSADDLAQAVELYRRSGWLGGEAECLFDLGLTERVLGRLHEAAQHQTQALALYRRLDSHIGVTSTLGALGEIDHDLGRLETARRRLTSAMRLYQELGLRFGHGYFLRCLAALDRDAGRTKEALAQAQDALRLAGEIGDRFTEARVRIVLAGIHLRLGSAQDAGDHYRQALMLAQQIPSPVFEADAQLGLADVCLTLDQPHQALQRAHRALGSAAMADMRILEGHAHTTLATAYDRLGRHHQALMHARQALKLHRQTGHRLGVARALQVLGCVLRDAGAPERAARCWQEALELFTDIGSPGADEVRALLADLTGVDHTHPRAALSQR